MKGRQIAYSAEELAWLSANQSLMIGEYNRQFCERFSRDVTAVNLHALRKRKGWKTGRTGCFELGSKPHNKDQKCAAGTGGLHPNALKTQFQAGNLSGTAARNYKAIGFERLSKDGYWERKVHDGLPAQSRWRTVQLIKWEAINGPMPTGMVLKCRGDRLNTDVSNWELVPRSILPRLNGGRNKMRVAYDGAPDQLKPTILAVAKLEHAARQTRRSQKAEERG